MYGYLVLDATRNTTPCAVFHAHSCVWRNPPSNDDRRAGAIRETTRSFGSRHEGERCAGSDFKRPLAGGCRCGEIRYVVLAPPKVRVGMPLYRLPVVLRQRLRARHAARYRCVRRQPPRAAGIGKDRGKRRGLSSVQPSDVRGVEPYVQRSTRPIPRSCA